jgi:NAD(P)H-hydrate epimerase
LYSLFNTFLHNKTHAAKILFFYVDNIPFFVFFSILSVDFLRIWTGNSINQYIMKKCTFAPFNLMEDSMNEIRPDTVSEVRDNECLTKEEGRSSFVELVAPAMRALLHPRDPNAHKGTFGHGLLVAGCDRMPGAAVLAATAAMRGGIGKLTVHTVRSVRNILVVSLPEAIHDIDDNEQYISHIDWNHLPENINAVALGPGMGTAKQTVAAMKDILDTVKSPLVIDADALNMLSENKTWLAFLPPYSILTPHFAEFERLAGKPADDADRIARAKAFAQRYSVILVLKGHRTVISLPDGRQFVNTTGNSGMATAGSGDVLTGLLLSLLAQGYPPEHAAMLGVWLHGAAGDAYAESHESRTLIASDLTRYFSDAFFRIMNCEL